MINTRSTIDDQCGDRFLHSALRALCVVIVCAPAAGVADDARSEPLMDHWLGRLQSESFIQRDYAMRKLEPCGESIVPRLKIIARGDNQAAATAAIRFMEQLAYQNGGTAEAAHRALAALSGDHAGMTESIFAQVNAALRRADRRVVGIVTALGGSIERDDQLRITSVHINDERFTNQQARVLTRLAGLKRLDLRKTSITDQSLPALAMLPALEFLNLTDTKVTGSGLRDLAPLSHLHELVIYRIEISSDDRRWFAEHLANCEIDE